jgi:hypothetical protein
LVWVKPKLLPEASPFDPARNRIVDWGNGPIDNRKSASENFFVTPARFERATYSLEGCCSIQLSYGVFENGLKTQTFLWDAFGVDLNPDGTGYFLVTFTFYYLLFVSFQVTLR